MALPALHALEECSDFSKTVQPFLLQLYDLPQKLLAVLQKREGFLDLYINTNPLISALALCLVLGAVFVVVSEVNRNYSQVDRCWSILPTIYIAHFDIWARLNGVPSDRLDAALLFSTIWSIRLTFNYARKGGYNIGHEDYRWEVVKSAIPAWAFHIFNFIFISFVQSVYLFLIAAPTYPLLLSIQFEESLSNADMAYTAFELGLILIEFVSDQQQWEYQTAKQEYQKSAKVPPGYTQLDMDRGFVTQGLWAYSRHPNFAAEQAIWFVLYQWSCFATKVPYSWAAAGAVNLIILFQGSTFFTEWITSGKYIDYKHYQKKVGMFVPKGLAYKPPTREPKVIRTSELAKRQELKERESKKQK